MLNHITIMGRLVADPELRTTPGGVTVATVRLAVDRDFKNKQTGERETDFINVVAWRQTAEFISRYFAKGRMAVVEGRHGNKRTAAEVVAENIYFGDSVRRDGEGGGSYSPSSYAAPASRPAPGYEPPMGDEDQFAELSDDDGDLPF